MLSDIVLVIVVCFMQEMLSVKIKTSKPYKLYKSYSFTEDSKIILSEWGRR